MRTRIVSVLASLVLAAAAAAQSTAFTYQGRLKNGAALAAGLHDFRFRLYDAASGGTQIGSTQCADNVAVAEGLFTTTLDFGQQFATTGARFLEIEVRADTGLNCSNTTGFVLLSPRQALTPAPLASHANAAFSLDAANGSIASAVFVDSAGKVGVGTLAPTHTVHVASGAPTIALQDTDSTSDQVGYLSYRDSANVERAWIGYGTPGSPDLSIVNARPSGNIILLPLGGKVGIGSTGAPTALLDLRPASGLLAKGLYSEASGQLSAAVVGEVTTTLGETFGGTFRIHSDDGSAVEGFAASSTGATDAVKGTNLSTDVNSHAVFANGRFVASGPKSFRIDHPTDPLNRYLLHYCAEGPEITNFYSGKATLDGRGEAVVQLPYYFAAINRDPRYTLTAVGAPMPELHIATEIDEASLARGNAAGAGNDIPVCWFRIAGGVPGGRVSWRLEALRNDRWVQRYGAPVETDKPERERGTYQRPELYDAPPEAGADHQRAMRLRQHAGADSK